MPLGESSCTKRLRSRAGCSPPTPHFTITVSGMRCLRSNSAFDAICSPDRSTPIAVGSNANGRYAREKAESPFACRCHSSERLRQTQPEEEPAKPPICNAFRFRAYWFVLAQTEGEETHTSPIPGFDLDTALHALKITRTAFSEINGNVQGFARDT